MNESDAKTPCTIIKNIQQILYNQSIKKWMQKCMWYIAGVQKKDDLQSE